MERYRLYSYIDNNKELAQQITAVNFAKKATEDLGFEVGPASVQRARESLGIRSRARATTTSKDRTRLLCKYVIDLFEALQMPVPEDLLLIKSGKSAKSTGE